MGPVLGQEQVVTVLEAVQEAALEQEKEPFVGLSPGPEAELEPVGNPGQTTGVSYFSRTSVYFDE